jgi:glycosyltransferase involved in cell wall biosynthesis
MKKNKICFVNLVNPNFLGGVSLYQKNLINNLDKTKYEITWIYKSYKEERYSLDGVNYVGLKVKKILFIDDILFNYKVGEYLKKNYFDIINSHAMGGYWLKNYKRKNSQKLIHTYHGLAVPYYKVQLRKYNLLKRILISSILLPLGFFMDKPPMDKADRIICVSNKVKKQVEKTYFKRKNIYVIRTGVELSKFKLISKKDSRKKINLEPEKIYGLYVGKGGYWIKGLDRAVKLSEELYKSNKNFRLIVLGSDYKKVKNLINKEFVIYLKEVDRDTISLYYSSSDFFFCLSRYEGGAPTLVVSEAMASGCLLICSEDSEQEILEDNYNSLVIKKFNEEGAKKIISVLNNDKLKRKLIKNSLESIKKISLKEWARQILDVFLN